VNCSTQLQHCVYTDSVDMSHAESAGRAYCHPQNRAQNRATFRFPVYHSLCVFVHPPDRNNVSLPPATPLLTSSSSSTEGTATASSSQTMALPLTPFGHLYLRKGGVGLFCFCSFLGPRSCKDWPTGKAAAAAAAAAESVVAAAASAEVQASGSATPWHWPILGGCRSDSGTTGTTQTGTTHTAAPCWQCNWSEGRSCSESLSHNPTGAAVHTL